MKSLIVAWGSRSFVSRAGLSILVFFGSAGADQCLSPPSSFCSEAVAGPDGAVDPLERRRLRERISGDDPGDDRYS